MAKKCVHSDQMISPLIKQRQPASSIQQKNAIGMQISADGLCSCGITLKYAIACELPILPPPLDLSSKEDEDFSMYTVTRKLPAQILTTNSGIHWQTGGRAQSNISFRPIRHTSTQSAVCGQIICVLWLECLLR